MFDLGIYYGKILTNLLNTSIYIWINCLRSYIKTRLLLGLTATQIHNELAAVYGPDVVSYSAVTRWIQRFLNKRESLEDNPRSGRPLSAITQQNIDGAKDLVNDDSHIIIGYVATVIDTVITSLIMVDTRRYQ
ncbi:unnamed protein product [Adineta steineri]|uniref:Mos1 transposase HTH domain-containing protein n=1 Tax=Adineta steineri TaxID=433720 RepID=A0A815YRN3_9BILA|nr:unnamed protein product [Adineta steineri]CAF1670702.1 unnamed protein product [Adineta steineri]